MPGRLVLVLLILASLQAANAGLIINVAFDDPGNFHSAHYDDLTASTQAAGQQWSNFLVGSASLEVLISFSNLGPTVTGASLTAAFLEHDGGFNIFEQGAAAELRTGIDPNGLAPDIAFNFNSVYLQGLFFDPAPLLRSSIVPFDRTDAMSVLLHEFGHAFAFSGWRNSFDATIPADYQSTFDRWQTFDGSNIFFNGPNAMAAYGGPVPLTWSNSGHVGNDFPRPGADLIPDLMNGVVFFLGNKYEISPLDLAILQDSGVALIPEPESWVLALLGIAAIMLMRRRTLQCSAKAATPSSTDLLPLGPSPKSTGGITLNLSGL
jgi:hypothetical protein